MDMNETVVGNQVVVITGTAKDGKETFGIHGRGDSVSA
jgi:hypothetical protein